MFKIILRLGVICILCAMPCTMLSYAGERSLHNYKPAKGYVPDEATAIRIAEAVWLPIYGERIYSKRPFRAELRGEVWIVTGTLPPNYDGGVPLAEIAKETGCILRISHGQ